MNTPKFLYAARDTASGDLVSNITNPGRKFWHRKADAVAAINRYNGRTVKYKHGELELVVFELNEVSNDPKNPSKADG